MSPPREWKRGETGRNFSWATARIHELTEELEAVKAKNRVRGCTGWGHAGPWAARCSALGGTCRCVLCRSMPGSDTDTLPASLLRAGALQRPQGDGSGPGQAAGRAGRQQGGQEAA